MGYSEGGPLFYNTDHKDGGKTIGTCGVIVKYWGEHLKERGIPINSLQACAEIYKFYLEQTNNPVQAMKEYKGIESKDKMWIVRKVFRVKNELDKNNPEALK